MDQAQIKTILLSLSSESDSDAAADEEILLYLISKRIKSRNSVYLSKRITHGEFKRTSQFSDSTFTSYFGMSRTQFNEIHELIKTAIYTEGCIARKPIGTEEKLAVFLRFLTSGNTYKNIGYSYRMGDRTVSNIIKEVSLAIWKCMQPKYLPEPTKEMWESVAQRFEQKWQFPHCVGALDGKHIVICRTGSSNIRIHYKRAFSVVLMAVVDADYKFVAIDIGSIGRFTYKGTFSTNALAKKMENQNLHLPMPTSLPMITNPMPYVFIANETFPLSQNLMRPYPKRKATGNYKRQIFNIRLSQARETVEHAFGMLASRFHIFRRPFSSKVESVVDIIKASCLLHNYLGNMTASNSEIENVEKLPTNQLLPLRGNNARYSSSACRIRDNFTYYFNNS